MYLMVCMKCTLLNGYVSQRRKYLEGELDIFHLVLYLNVHIFDCFIEKNISDATSNKLDIRKISFCISDSLYKTFFSMRMMDSMQPNIVDGAKKDCKYYLHFLFDLGESSQNW